MTLLTVFLIGLTGMTSEAEDSSAMLITKGLSPHQVVQQEDGAARIACRGLTGNQTAKGVVEARIPGMETHNTWRVAEDPLHRPYESSYDAYNPPAMTEEQKAAFRRLEQFKGAGLGMPFAEEVFRATGCPIGLIPCAIGGTSMDQWSPDLKGEEGGLLYGAMLDRFRAVGGSVRGVLWWQGESDAVAPAVAEKFEAKFLRFVEEVRKDFQNPDLPFYCVQIGRAHMAEGLWHEPSWNLVQQTQSACEPLIAHSAMAPSVDLELDDLVHVGARGLKRVGRRLAKLVLRDVYDGPQLHGGPGRTRPYGRIRRTALRYASDSSALTVVCNAPAV